jgi:hypothetical protein
VADPKRADPQNRLRDNRALARFELFLFAAVATVLLVRTFLAVSGYPQVGGGGLHIAHVLWGGLLMGVAIVLVEILPGSRPKIWAALLGGVGFGLFIDEVGKFLTKDVDYFFKPAVAIIYAVLVGFYVVVSLILQHRPLNDRRRLALATSALEDLALGQLDAASRDYALQLLGGVDDTSALRKTAEAVRAGLLAEPPDPRSVEIRLTHLRERVGDRVHREIHRIGAGRVVLTLAIVEVVVVAGAAVLLIVHPAPASIARSLIDVGLPSLASLVLIGIAISVLSAGRVSAAAELVQWAVVVELLFTEVVIFYRQQFLGLGGFVVNLAVLALVRVVQRTPERRADDAPA